MMSPHVLRASAAARAPHYRAALPTASVSHHTHSASASRFSLASAAGASPAAAPAAVPASALSAVDDTAPGAGVADTCSPRNSPCSAQQRAERRRAPRHRHSRSFSGDFPSFYSATPSPHATPSAQTGAVLASAGSPRCAGLRGDLAETASSASGGKYPARLSAQRWSLPPGASVDGAVELSRVGGDIGGGGGDVALHLSQSPRIDLLRRMKLEAAAAAASCDSPSFFSPSDAATARAAFDGFFLFERQCSDGGVAHSGLLSDGSFEPGEESGRFFCVPAKSSAGGSETFGNLFRLRGVLGSNGSVDSGSLGGGSGSFGAGGSGGGSGSYSLGGGGGITGRASISEEDFWTAAGEQSYDGDYLRRVEATTIYPNPNPDHIHSLPPFHHLPPPHSSQFSHRTNPPYNQVHFPHSVTHPSYIVHQHGSNAAAAAAALAGGLLHAPLQRVSSLTVIARAASPLGAPGLDTAPAPAPASASAPAPIPPPPDAADCSGAIGGGGDGGVGGSDAANPAVMEPLMGASTFGLTDFATPVAVIPAVPPAFADGGTAAFEEAQPSFQEGSCTAAGPVSSATSAAEPPLVVCSAVSRSIAVARFATSTSTGSSNSHVSNTTWNTSASTFSSERTSSGLGSGLDGGSSKLGGRASELGDKLGGELNGAFWRGGEFNSFSPDPDSPGSPDSPCLSPSGSPGFFSPSRRSLSYQPQDGAYNEDIDHERFVDWHHGHRFYSEYQQPQDEQPRYKQPQYEQYPHQQQLLHRRHQYHLYQPTHQQQHQGQQQQQEEQEQETEQEQEEQQEQEQDPAVACANSQAAAEAEAEARATQAFTRTRRYREETSGVVFIPVSETAASTEELTFQAGSETPQKHKEGASGNVFIPVSETVVSAEELSYPAGSCSTTSSHGHGRSSFSSSSAPTAITCPEAAYNEDVDRVRFSAANAAAVVAGSADASITAATAAVNGKPKSSGGKGVFFRRSLSIVKIKSEAPHRRSFSSVLLTSVQKGKVQSSPIHEGVVQDGLGEGGEMVGSSGVFGGAGKAKWWRQWLRLKAT